MAGLGILLNDAPAPVVSQDSEPLPRPVVYEQPTFPGPPVDSEVAQLVNSYREQNGLRILTRIPELDASAMEKCLDMQANKYWSHNNPVTGETPFDVIEKHVWYRKYAGENLARGGRWDSAMVIDKWKTSTNHNELMLEPHYRKTGVAVCYEDASKTLPTDSRLIVQHFID